MKRISTIILCITLVFSCLALPSCSQKELFSSYSFDCFNTVSSVMGYEESKEKFDQTSDIIMSMLTEYHKLFDIYHTYDGINNLCTLNNTQGEVKVDKKIVDMLTYAKEMYELTEGRVNIAMGSVLSIWHDYRTQGKSKPSEAKLPPTETLEKAAKHTNIESIIIDEKNLTVTLNDPEMSLDVGAIAKGYAVEQVAKALEAQGIEGYLLNIGGNVRAVGKSYNGIKWRVGIENPTGDESKPNLETATIEQMSIVSSGSTQRYYIVENKKYHHIIDPNTLMPSDIYLSVSIITQSSALADALSTALFTMPHDRGYALIESLDGVEAMWVFKDETIKYSNGFKSFCQ